jgi:uncharacterized protein YqgV (UPF0045/DUF77 family)
VYNVGSKDCITVKEVADIVVGALELKDVKYMCKPVGTVLDGKEISVC